MSERCPICDSAARFVRDGTSSNRSPDDVRITDARYGETLPLYACGTCGFLFADPELVGSITSLYDDLDDPEYIDTEPSRRKQMVHLVEQALELAPKATSLLDVGAASGLLVEVAAERGINAVGVELSEPLVHEAQAKGREVYRGSWPNPSLEGRTFDVVTLIDVIEHVEDPVELLRGLRSALAPGGVLVVVTPDVSSVAAKLLGWRWWHYRLAHVGYFSPETMELAAANAGLKVQQMAWTSWHFPVWYLADRVGRFLPVNRMNRVLRAAPLVGRAYEKSIPLNLFDSRLFFLEADDS